MLLEVVVAGQQLSDKDRLLEIAVETGVMLEDLEERSKKLACAERQIKSSQRLTEEVRNRPFLLDSYAYGGVKPSRGNRG
jgi:hypothetical protein